MSSKKYYWLKLKDDFFRDPKIKKLRKIAGGDTYTIILQKIMLLSISEGGVIKFQGLEKSLQEELALILDEDVSNIEIALSFMNSTGLIEPLSDKEFLLPSVPTLIGKEGDSAERMRKLREKNKAPNQLPSHCDGTVTKSDTEKREKRKELEKDMGGNAREEYLYFRMAGEGIKNPIAFKKTIMSEMQDPRSDESKNFVNWQDLMTTWPKSLNDLYQDFCSFGHKNRKKCKEIATDHVKDFGINITPMLFEIAFYESCKLQQGKGVA
ncbi:MAG: phage replisome organizer N-terminal domain-containing protein [Sulfuricurvum sp.]|uniref:phage replisome organizer N-terminal domain-containing protein n=1 Tax=Sulfuricurvum sp. TaxID=2025608 RepID=UPI002733300E|nr:phage replisome organizer N-terminal domain-containing protein [Sulfuricurvum sp.]MDP2850297.1 phage replisome organizer N-terminal domain-containing protein [Sulfuricurvum sp.]